ncbi:MAG: murein biosynthesis integral membrane protein MurJ [Actinobacteria bacterium]|nr:murein biosynthesis integral membrane protein MurJ [Actinomycetota bacterium]
MREDFLSSRKRIFGATFMVTVAILLSKISGLARDQIMAGYFGISYDTDAFTWANFIPNLFRILFAESLIVAAFIPIYSTYLKKDRKDDIKIFVNSVATIMLAVFFAISLALFILSPWIGVMLSKIAGNQMDVGSFTIMSRIMIFSLLTLSISGLATGILNSHDIFFIPSLAPMILNLVTIIFVVTLFSRWGIISMAAGVMAGSVMHMLIQFPQLKFSGIGYRPLINIKHEGVREIFSLMLPILLSLGAVQLNNGVDNFFALNLGEGNTTALTLSWRVANLPLGVFSVAIITVLYPLISRQAASEDIKGLKDSFSLGVREIGYIMIPATVGLATLSHPIIKMLFEHYSFGPQDTVRVSHILIFHCAGLVFFGLLMILNRIFYAFKDVKTPLRVACISIAVNLFLDWILVRFMDAAGLALSTSLVAMCNVIILLIILRKKTGSLGGRRITVSYIKISIASALMGTVLYFLWKYLEVFAFKDIFSLIFIMAGMILLGTGVYVLLTILFKMDEVRFVLKLFRRAGENQIGK